MREIGVGLIGLGNVGAGVVKLLAENAAAIEARLGARVAVRAIAVRDVEKDRLVEVDRGLLTTDINAVIDRDDIEIVCELIGGTDRARSVVLRAIERKKHVVTANKALLAMHGEEVFSAAEAAGVDLYYEAAVCGGVPIIRALREGLASDRIDQITGIVNGTSNFILTEMTDAARYLPACENRRRRPLPGENGESSESTESTGKIEPLPFAAVLAEAQRLGYAEADPTLDVGGGDAAHKLAILIMLCFGAGIDANDMFVEGIDRLDPVDFAYAERFGYVIKPLAIARDHEDGIEARVHPTMIPQEWLLAGVPGAKNALYVTSYALGGSMYYGAGAGMMPTAMAAVSDLIEVCRNIQAGAAGALPLRSYQRLVHRPIRDINQLRTRYYLRFGVLDRAGVLGQITSILGDHEISIAEVVQEGVRDPGRPVRIVVVTHESSEGNIRHALAQIAKLTVVVEPAAVIRIGA